MNVKLTLLVTLLLLRSIAPAPSSMTAVNAVSEPKEMIWHDGTYDLSVVATRACRDNWPTRELGLSSQEPPADSILLNVTVKSAKNKRKLDLGESQLVSGLPVEAFTVYDNEVPQKISRFSTDDLPISIGIIIDTSSSLDSTMLRLNSSPLKSTEVFAKGIERFIQQSNPHNQYFLMSFGDHPELLVDWTADEPQIAQAIAHAKLRGRSSLVDAFCLGINKISQGKHRKRVLLLITSGVKEKSQCFVEDMLERLEKSGASVYTLILPIATNSISPEVYKLGYATGGLTFTMMRNQFEPEQIFSNLEEIALELRHQYMIEFLPSNSGTDKTQHHLRIDIKPPPTGFAGLHILRARTRNTYRPIKVPS